MRRLAVTTSLLVWAGSADLLVSASRRTRRPTLPVPRPIHRQCGKHYEKMWEGEWETTITMPIDLPGKIEIKKGIDLRVQ